MGVVSYFPGGAGVKVPDVEELWNLSVARDRPINDIEADQAGNIYSVSGFGTLLKSDRNGIPVWELVVGSRQTTIVALAPGGGNLYVVEAGNVVYEVDSFGVTSKNYPCGDSGTNLYAMAVTENSVANSTSSFVFAGGDGKKLHKLDFSDGNVQWSFTVAGGVIYAAIAEGDGSVYCGGGDKIVRKISEAGMQLWECSNGLSAVRALTIDNSGGVYAGHEDGSLSKVSTSGALVWKAHIHDKSITSLCVDSKGNIQSASADGKIKRVNAIGTKNILLADFKKSVNAISTKQDNLLYAGLLDGTVKGLSFPVGYITTRDGNNKKITKSILRVLDSGDPPISKWSLAFSYSEVVAIATDYLGNAYIATSTNGYVLYKLSPDGTRLWTYSGPDSVRSMATDDKGNLYCGGKNKVRMFNTQGQVMWTTTTSPSTSANILSVVVDRDGNTYVGAGSVQQVYKISNDGTKIWDSTTNNTGAVKSVAVDLFGEVYAGCYDSKWYLRKISREGERLDIKYSHIRGAVQSVVTDSFNNVYVGCSDKSIVKMNRFGALVWKFSGYTGSVETLALDNENNIYSNGGEGEIKKINTRGEQVWGYKNTLIRFAHELAVDQRGNVFVESINDVVSKMEQQFTVSFSGR